MVFNPKCIKSSLKYSSIVLGFIIMTGVSYLSFTEKILTEKLKLKEKEKEYLNFIPLNNLKLKSNSNKNLFFFKKIQKIIHYDNKKYKNTKFIKSKNCFDEENRNSDLKILTDLIAKSIMAFLAGCILSEKKFFCFGII